MIWRLAVLLLAAVAGSGSPPRTHTVEIRAMEFHPAVLAVAPGDTVVWINRDIVPHTATAKNWDTMQLSQHQEGHIVVRRSGRVEYVCALHPMMHGTLVVRD